MCFRFIRCKHLITNILDSVSSCMYRIDIGANKPLVTQVAYFSCK
jgi:hypothetical protein